MAKKIKIELSETPKGQKSAVLAVDILGLLAIEELFLNLANGNTNQTLISKNKIQIDLYNDLENSGLIKVGNILEWRQTKDKWNQFRGQTTGLYRCGATGQCNLESGATGDSEYKVIVSLIK